jgi:phage N-6-adenine-methyltransferase
MTDYQQLDLFDLTEAIKDTAKRIADGELANADDKLDLAEQMYEARRRMPADREYGNWWKTTGIEYGRSWRAVLVRAGERIADTGRPGVRLLDTGGEFSIERFANTGDGWTTESDTHVTHNSGAIEWYTPEYIVDAAREALGGGIDLDPASTAAANEWIQAEQFYSVDDDGLTHDWHGRVWMNPPYASGVVEDFVDKLLGEYSAGNITAAVVLTNNSTDTGWWQRLANTARAICYIEGRVKFKAPDGERNTPLQGQTICYLGSSLELFVGQFQGFGVILS